MKTRMVTVLDLGTTKVAGMIASEGDQGAVRIHGTAVEPCKGIRRGVVTDLDETARGIDAVLRALREETGHDASSVTVGVTGAHIEGTTTQGFVPIYPRSRSITRDDVLQVIRHSRQLQLSPDREQIQAIPREFQVDGERGVQRPVGMVGSRLEVMTYVVTGQSTHIQNVERAVSMCGKQVDNMVLESLASGLGVLTQEEMELGTVVADIGGGSTDLAIFSGGSISYSAVIPVGGVLVTSDLSKLLKTSPEEAERLKTEFGAATSRYAGEAEIVQVRQLGQDGDRPMQRRVLCEIIESRMREIAVMVRQQLEKSGHMGLLPGGMVLTGGGAMLRGTDAVFEDTLKHMRVRTVEPSIPNAHAHDHSFATALGMARFAIECGSDELVPAGGNGDWKETIRTLWSMIKR